MSKLGRQSALSIHIHEE